MTAQKKPALRRKPGPKAANAVVPPALTKEDRERRDHLIFARFLAGHSESEIGRAVGVTGQRVHQILKRELKNAARHQELLTTEALAMYVARLETLIKATWPAVIRGDLKAVDTARRLMESQARLYNLEGEGMGSLPMPEELLDEDNPANVDELTRYRMAHRRRPDEAAQ